MNWKTTLFGILAIVLKTTGASLASAHPDYGPIFDGAATAAGGIGLILAADAKKKKTTEQK